MYDGICAHACMCMSRPQVDSQDYPLILFHLIHSLSIRPRVHNIASLSSKLVLGILCILLLMLELQVNCHVCWHLSDVRGSELQPS